jgi:hypothetical protein
MLTKDEQLIGFQNGFIPLKLYGIILDFLLEIRNHLISESEFPEKINQFELEIHIISQKFVSQLG